LKLKYDKLLSNFACFAFNFNMCHYSKGMMGSLFAAGGIQAVEGESDEALKQRLLAVVTQGFLEVEDILAALPGPFLGGERPNQSDAFMVGRCRLTPG